MSSDNNTGFKARRRFYIGWNRFNGRCHANTAQGVQNGHVVFRMHQNPTSVAEFNQYDIYRNYFYDPTTIPTVHHITAGDTKVQSGDYHVSTNGIIEYNYADTGSSRSDFLYLKRQTRFVRFNHCATTAATTRSGSVRVGVRLSRAIVLTLPAKPCCMT